MLKIGVQPGNGNFDPVLFAGAVGDILLQQQIYEKLVTLGPGLHRPADAWPPSGTRRTARCGRSPCSSGVKFSNGQPFTSADVVYTMNRLRSKKLGSPMADVYANIKSITAPDPTTVVFTLRRSTREFPASLTDYRALMLCKSVKDPAKDPVGTGPFMLKSISAEDRAVLVKNPNYWGKDAQGNQLPVSRRGRLHLLARHGRPGRRPPGRRAQLGRRPLVRAEADRRGQPSAQDRSTQPTNYCFELQIRCDEKPGQRPRVPPGASWPAPTCQASSPSSPPASPTPGNGTLVGPAYKADYLDAPSVAYDPAKAKQLLAQAGYANGVTIKLVAQNTDPDPGHRHRLAGADEEDRRQRLHPAGPAERVLRRQGHGQLVPGGVQHRRLGHAGRAHHVLPAGADQHCAWNYSRWKDPQFDTLVKQISTELNPTKRAALYKQAQQILQQQVPMINFLESDGGRRPDRRTVDGIVPRARLAADAMFGTRTTRSDRHGVDSGRRFA